MPTIRANDITMYYEIHGEGEPVVLIAGLNSDHTLFRGILPQLATRYQVIVFDNRGVGQTDKPDIPYSIDMMADDTAGLLQALGITQANILGLSMGGRIAASLALRHPQQVTSLILASTVVKMKGIPMTWQRRLSYLSLRIPMIRGSHPYYAAARQRDASRDFDCTDRLGEIHMPTLILHGKDDKLAPYSLAEEMHNGIKGSQMITFQGGHYVFVLRQREFVDAICEFLDSLQHPEDENKSI
ncbi:MAG TPA: alpha/beta hydrolase [Ktedonobacterales bacterium]|nr:alpha/beta hydrolase [Ktedonobacterales bacterium]